MEKLLTILLCILLFTQCNAPSKSTEIESQSNVQIKFNSLEKQKTSLISDISFVQLETSDESLIGEINQIVINEGYIYILCDSGLYVFDLSGKYIKSKQRTGSGPGEFLTAYSFWIDKDGFVFILDRLLNRLLKYNIENLDFVETIIMPFDYPLSFAKTSNENAFIYYYPLNTSNGIEENQIIIANDNGEIMHELYEGDDSGKILHGNRSNFYTHNNKLKFYPYFSNKIYAIEDDVFNNIYTLTYKDNNFPTQDIFTRYDNSGDIMKEIIFGNNKWIRLIYVYETDSFFAVKYYIERDFYMSIWEKDKENSTNFKYDNVIDDIGIGGKFPLPIGVHDNQFIGIINLYDLDESKINNINLEKIIESSSEEDNPILCLYSVKL